MLFDDVSDPYQLDNLVGKPAYADIQAQLHVQLEELRKKYGDNDEMNQKFIDEYKEKVKANPRIEYWKYW